MARKTTNLAALDIATAAVKHIVSCTYEVPDRPVVKSEALTDNEVDVMGVGAVDGPRTMNVTVELDSTDTNGQGALQTGFEEGTVVEGVVFYPEGKVTGSPKFAGSVYVTSGPRYGSEGNENKTRKGTYKFAWTTKPVPGTYTAP